MIELLTAGLITMSSVFLLLAAVGIVRMPDLYTRIAASTKAVAFGGGLMFLAVAVYFDDVASEVRALAGVGFLVMTASLTAHVLGRAAFHVGVPFTPGTDSPEFDRAATPGRSGEPSDSRPSVF